MTVKQLGWRMGDYSVVKMAGRLADLMVYRLVERMVGYSVGKMVYSMDGWLAPWKASQSAAMMALQWADSLVETKVTQSVLRMVGSTVC